MKTTKESRKLTCRGSCDNHVTTNCENPQLRNAQFLDKAGAFAYFCVYSCYFKILTFYPWRWTFETLSARENTETTLRVYVLLWESARECARPQVCASVHSNRNGLTGENTFAFATGVYYNVVFKSSKWFRTCPEMPTAYITCTDKGAVK
jgi:hypothetical protein